METNYHFNITTPDKTYEFDLLAKNSDLSQGYTVIEVDERDKQFIQQLIKDSLAQIEGSRTIDSLVNKLRHLSVVSIEMASSAKTHSVGISTIRGEQEIPILVHKPIKEIAKSIYEDLKKTCPEGAGSIVMISRPGETAACVSAGACSVGGSPIDGQTAGLIGSGAKIFTSLCALALISRGAEAVNNKGESLQPLTLNTKVSDVFSAKQMLIFDDQTKASEITLGMLLSHTSGLVYFANDNQDIRQGMSLSAILDGKEPGSVKFFGYPGDQIYSYSNHINLVAAMLEIGCGEPYEVILQEELLVPLGMKRTSYKCPHDDNVLRAYCPPTKSENFPSSVKKEVKDPMMQGAGGLWTCMDDMEKLGTALGTAISKKSDLIGQNGKVIINTANLNSMTSRQSFNAHCGLAFDLSGDAIGKGGSVHGYDFKFMVDTKSGSCVSMMCNYAGQGKFENYLGLTSKALKELNPKIFLPQITREASVKIEISKELSIEECSQKFKGFSGLLAFPEHRPLTQINFNGMTLPVSLLKTSKGTIESYMIKGDSPFQGLKLQIYQQNEHLYPCISDGAFEVWSFGEIKETKFPIIILSEFFEKFESASGDYIDISLGGPPPRQIRIDSTKVLTLSFPDTAPSNCLITAQSDNEVSFRACLGGGPQGYSYKLIKKETLDWELIILNGETEDPIFYLPQNKV